MYFTDARLIESAAPSVGLLAQEVGVAIARGAAPLETGTGARRHLALAAASK
jgi:hypothetical protein